MGSRLHEECIITRLSSNKNYISVTVGPVLVETPDQVGEGGGHRVWGRGWLLLDGADR